jgi:sphinganine-1-phosphate aldolase
MKLAPKRRPYAEVMAELQEKKREDFAWRGGRLPLYIYYSDEELLRLQCAAFSEFMVENVHGSKTVFPSVEKMQSEVVAMCLDLFGAPQGATGSFTSGGSESILLAVKTARDWARQTKPAVTRPVLLLPVSAHPAFDKAAHLFGLESRRVELAGDHRADVERMAAQMTEDVIMMAGSAPAYPHGVFDPIERLAALAHRHGVWFHVDACFGGFLAPFARELGYPIPRFEMSVPGVWSLSADLHKYGFAAKGASFLGLARQDLFRFQEFQSDCWPRGSYSSPGLPGSRPAGAVAAAWAVMNFLGREGYVDLARRTMNARDRLVQGVSAITPLRCLQPCELSIVVIVSQPHLDIRAVAEGLMEQGWFASRTSSPPGLHFTVNPVHEPIVDDYLAALERAVRSASGRAVADRQSNSTY